MASNTSDAIVDIVMRDSSITGRRGVEERVSEKALRRGEGVSERGFSFSHVEMDFPIHQLGPLLPPPHLDADMS